MKRVCVASTADHVSLDLQAQDWMCGVTAGSFVRQGDKLQSTARFTVSALANNVSISVSPARAESERKTRRLNRALTLGYLPAIQETSQK